jgi:KipI family sensor histidine kinase inhibitor
VTTPGPVHRILPAGERAVLVELTDLAAVHRLHRAVLAAGIAVDAVPGERTLLVVGDGDPRRLAATVESLASTPDPAPAPGRVVEIAVRYDGPDLLHVAGLVGLTVDEVIDAHTSSAWTVAFLGFLAGFPYLTGGDARLEVDRLADPRPLVPAGSVALAAGYTGIYPAASPGGWRVIGRTDHVLFDPEADPPALLEPGDTVRFVPHG